MERPRPLGQPCAGLTTTQDPIAADLHAAGIRHVIVGPMAARDAMVAFFSNLFGRPPVEVDGVAIWRDVDVAGVR